MFYINFYYANDELIHIGYTRNIKNNSHIYKVKQYKSISSEVIFNNISKHRTYKKAKNEINKLRKKHGLNRLPNHYAVKEKTETIRVKMSIAKNGDGDFEKRKLKYIFRSSYFKKNRKNIYHADGFVTADYKDILKKYNISNMAMYNRMKSNNFPDWYIEKSETVYFKPTKIQLDILKKLNDTKNHLYFNRYKKTSLKILKKEGLVTDVYYCKKTLTCKAKISKAGKQYINEYIEWEKQNVR